jgi:hypothetical protein
MHLIKKTFVSAVATEYIKKNVDLIISLLLLAVTISTPWWIPTLIPSINVNILVATISPVATAIGVLIAHRTNEKLRNPKLTIVSLNFFKFPNSMRVFVEVENGQGREIAKDARAVITIKKMIGNDIECDLDTDDFPRFKDELEAVGGFSIEHLTLLAPFENPRIEGEYIPWMVPEPSYRSKGLHGIEFKHITNIAPGERVRAAIFDVVKYIGKYYLTVFSEYGTEPERSSIEPGKFVRVFRCILRPGRYRFYLSISADKAYPVKALLEIDTLSSNKIVFKSSRFYESLDLTKLLP